MDLLALARTKQYDRERSVEHSVRLHRLLAGRSDLPGPTPAPEAGRSTERDLPQVPARSGSPR